MEDRLKSLGKVDIPAPSSQARDAALSAALTAFDQAADEKISIQTQGSGMGERLKSSANRNWRNFMTRNRLATSTALATVLILPLAGYLTWTVTGPGAPGVIVSERKEQPKAADTAKKLEQQSLTHEGKLKQDKAEAELRSEEQTEIAQLPQADAPVEAAPPAQLPLRGLNLNLKDSRARSLAQPGSQYGAASQQPVMRPLPPVDLVEPVEDRDRVQQVSDNPLKIVKEEPVSTFSADVDTASYSLVRRALNEGRLPDPETVRVEELVNYFPYDWQGPDSAATPFKANVSVMPTPWNRDTQILHIAVKGFDIKAAERPQANLVFLLDVSGSMNAPDKLPLLKSAFRLLIDKLQPEDTVSIVTYAGNAGTVLEPTKASDKARIMAAMDALEPGGSTAGAQGIEEAYRLAEKAFVKGGVNRVMLATDGDFNVGAMDDASLKRLIEKKRESGVFLSVFGFGQGNYNDQLMQVLAQNGNGVAAYIDTLAEAEKTLVQEAGSSLFPIASDVKFQIEFNPARVAEYRQIGFETRALKREDFNNDKVDAGDIGSGHTVTAIYEIVPVGSPAVSVSDLRYGEKAGEPVSASNEIAFVKMRAKRPGEAKSELTEIAVTDANVLPSLDSAPDDVRFSVAVAAFGQKLRHTAAVSDYSYDAIGDLAAGARGDDPFGYRAEFLKLVRLAGALDR
ncbi:MAG: VWA domain-containing protein [Nitratireductor sp.]|nr:VWA domain-containing protein [Nitratireductor sp.]